MPKLNEVTNARLCELFTQAHNFIAAIKEFGGGKCGQRTLSGVRLGLHEKAAWRQKTIHLMSAFASEGLVDGEKLERNGGFGSESLRAKKIAAYVDERWGLQHSFDLAQHALRSAKGVIRDRMALPEHKADEGLFRRTLGAAYN